MISAFDFSERTAVVFDDMVTRSVPCYAEIQRMVAELAGNFARHGTSIYDLGCATGTTLVHLAERYGDRPDVTFIGIDQSRPMLKRAREKLQRAGYENRCVFQRADLHELVIDNASVVTMILTLQFLPLLSRERVMKRVYQGLVPNGSLLLVEKVLCHDAGLTGIFADHYHRFKQRQGYSELEIAQKREALEHVLVPSRMEEHVALLERSGFSVIEVFFRWYNFAGLIAVK